MLPCASVFLQTETVLQMDKLYTVVKKILKLMFRTVVLCQSECVRDK